MRARDDVRADELADALGGFSAGLDGRADAADVALDDDGDEATADLNLANEGDVRRFDHGIAGLDAANVAFGFYHADRFIHDELVWVRDGMSAGLHGNAETANGIGDPVLQAAASRALSAVGRGAPYDGLPVEDYDSWKQFVVRFDGKEACR